MSWINHYQVLTGAHLSLIWPVWARFNILLDTLQAYGCLACGVSKVLHPGHFCIACPQNYLSAIKVQVKVFPDQNNGKKLFPCHTVLLFSRWESLAEICYHLPIPFLHLGHDCLYCPATWVSVKNELSSLSRVGQNLCWCKGFLQVGERFFTSSIPYKWAGLLSEPVERSCHLCETWNEFPIIGTET